MTDVTVEPSNDETEIEDVKVEEAQAEEPEQQDDQSQTEGETEEEQKPKTVEERLADIEARYEEKVREAEAKQKKIDRQTAAYHELQKRLESERQAIQAKLEAPKDDAPNIDDYDTHEDYVNAVAEYKAKQLIKAKEQEFYQKQQQETMQKMQQERAKIALEQEAEYLKINPRYEASKNEFDSFVKTLQVDQAVENAIVEAAFIGNVPSIIDYFGGNNGERLDELAEIARKSPAQAAIEIYKIQQKLGKPERKEEKPIPKPVASPKGTGKASKPVKDMNGKELLKWVNS